MEHTEGYSAAGKVVEMVEVQTAEEVWEGVAMAVVMMAENLEVAWEVEMVKV